jgi:hypothetical protein
MITNGAFRIEWLSCSCFFLGKNNGIINRSPSPLSPPAKGGDNSLFFSEYILPLDGGG